MGIVDINGNVRLNGEFSIGLELKSSLCVSRCNGRDEIYASRNALSVVALSKDNWVFLGFTAEYAEELTRIFRKV
eukprot:UN30226